MPNIPAIRILHLEDSPRDAEITQDRLEAGGLVCDTLCVDNQEQFESALAAGSFDVILCDYNLPDYDGLSALRLVRERYPETPVILISGSLGEDEAVKCLQYGATDYLLKQRIGRLPAAVKRALEQAGEYRKRRQAEARLRESEERFRQLAEHINEVFWMTNLEKNQMIYISPAYEAIWGRTCAALYASPGVWLDDIHPADRERILHSAFNNQSTSAYDEEYRIVRPDGTIRWIHDRAFPVRNQAGEIYRIAGVATDITERKRAQTALLTSESRLAEAQRIAHLGSWEWEAATDVVIWSKELCALLEVDPAKPAPSVAEQHKLYTPESMQRMHAAIEQAMRTGTPYEIELERVRADGTSKWLLARGEPLFNEQRQITGLRGTALDITKRKQGEDQLRLFRTLLNQSTDAIIVADPATARILDVNDSACVNLGYTREELLALRVMDIEANFSDFAAFERSTQQLKKAGAFHFEGEQRRKDGSTFPVEVSVRYVSRPEGDYSLAIARDVTERKHIERQLQRTQRLESIGTLAAGVAHDLNNALAPIMLGVQLIKQKYPQESQIVDMFDTSAQRGADMVRQLLTFAKGAEGERILIQPGRLVKELEKLMKGSFSKNIQLVVKCDPKLPAVQGDATQLHQVLLNLCVNARDAMPNGGTLTLEAQPVEVDAAYASSIPNAKPGKYVVLRVRDTGTGIPPEILDRIFEPFFTTKDQDKGTGLGLSMVMGIVRGHGGFLHVYSQPGQGSTFAAYLPADRAGSDTEHLTKVAEVFHGQGETILFVDDERALREVTSAVLRRLNFKPLTAMDGADGLIQAAQHRTELRAIITDLSMPHMDGLAFVRAVRRMLPDIPIMVVSGRMEDAVAGEFKTLGVKNRLDKPFTEAQLAEALKNLLTPK
jgi:PAS domain S-box-containing protein